MSVGYDRHDKRAEMGSVCSGLGSLLEGGPLEGVTQRLIQL